MPSPYLTIMALYTGLTIYILYLIIANLINEKNIWNQTLAVFVIVPFLMRIFFIK